MKTIVILTGAGMSAESGLMTFRDAGGLWEGHKVTDVATPEAWERDRALVLKFYNERRRQLLTVHPNPAHLALVELEKHFKVHIITQNVDDLHERAGSTSVLHLHGELLKARSTKDESLVYEWKKDIKEGDKCDLGSQLRPHIVWFREAVPKIEEAIDITRRADIFIVIGTSLVVYPAAGLIHYTFFGTPKYIIDPAVHQLIDIPNLFEIRETAAGGTPKLVQKLIEDEQSHLN